MGGGLYIGSATNLINAGYILNNYASSQGGGVYVASVPYTITIKDVTIHDNSAWLGGGMWNCPTGEAEIVVNNGALIYNNTASGAGDDFVSTSQVFMFSSTSQPTTLADYMLGGGLANWYRDGKLSTPYSSAETLGGSPTSDSVRYLPSGDNEAVSGIVQDKRNFALKALPTEEGIAAGESLAKVFIIGNSAGRGGGIGSNGSVILGDVYKQTKSVTAIKEWEIPEGSELEQPESITVYLVNESTGERIHEAVLNAENEWTVTWAGLALDIVYAVVEDLPEGWVVDYTAIVDFDNNLVVTITNKPIPDEPDEPIIVEDSPEEPVHPNTPNVEETPEEPGTPEEPETTIVTNEPTPTPEPEPEPEPTIEKQPAPKQAAKKAVKTKAALAPVVRASNVAQTSDEAPVVCLIGMVFMAAALMFAARRHTA